MKYYILINQVGSNMLPSQSFWDHFRVLHHGLHNVQAVETGAKHFFRYYPFLFPIGIFWVIFMVILWIMMKTHRKLLNLTTISLVAQWISCPNLRKCLITFPRVSLVWNSLNRKVQYIQYMLFVNEFNKYIVQEDSYDSTFYNQKKHLHMYCSVTYFG